MPSLSITVAHALGLEAAAARLRQRLADAKAQYADRLQDFEDSWQGETLRCAFKTYGVKIASTTTVAPQSVTVRVELPLMAMMFKGQIEKTVREELGKTLESRA